MGTLMIRCHKKMWKISVGYACAPSLELRVGVQDAPTVGGIVWLTVQGAGETNTGPIC